MDFDPELIVIQAASTEHDSLMIEGLMGEVLRLVHAEDSAVHMGSVEQTIRWNFYMVSVDRAVLTTLAQLLESGILDAKRSSLEQEFVSWLNLRAKARGANDKIHFDLRRT